MAHVLADDSAAVLLMTASSFSVAQGKIFVIAVLLHLFCQMYLHRNINNYVHTLCLKKIHVTTSLTIT